MTATLREELVSTPDAPALARRLLDRYLVEIGWTVHPHDDDLILAVSEAVSNAAQHAYPPDAPGPVMVTANVMAGPHGGERRVRVSVADQGRWHEPASDHPRIGLAMMRAACAYLSVQGDAAGTRLTLISHPITDRP